MEEDEYRTESEVEADSDHEEDSEYGGWLAHFNSAENVDSEGTGTVKRRNKTIVTPKMAMESFRFSFLNNEENQDVNFDAILGELCELETQLSTTQSELSQSLASCPIGMVNEHIPNVKKEGGGSDVIQAELDALAAEITQGLGYRNNVHGYMGIGQTTLDTTYDAGETDSAFSDNASLPSSESFTSMVTVSSSADTTSSSSGDTCSTSSAVSAATLQGEVHALIAHLMMIKEQLDRDQIPREEQKARLKAEKIRIALEKIKEAKIRKLFVRAFAKDGSSKSILVDEKMTVGQVSSVLADKNHVRLNPRLTVVEHMPDMLMERILEDHDSLVENMVMWTRDSKNKILFEERQEKYDLFKHPEKYLLVGTSSEKGVSLGPSQQERLIQEYFSSTCVKVPEVEGALYLKSDGKKAWKKYFFVLRASGLYYNPKGKISKSPKDLACLVQFDFVEPYNGIGWKKKYHAPTDHCFALKHPQIQKKNSKYIRYLCAESKTSMDQWIMGIRLAKVGKQILYNYEKLQHEISTWDLRDLNQTCNIPEQLLLNNVGNLHDSRMSVPEPGSRHSIVTVKNTSLVRKNSTSGPDCDNPNEVIGIDVTPMPLRKGSLGGYSGGDPSPTPKTPVKRVSFSNTHCIINAETGTAEDILPLRHRDSITSASTDSSEDSASSGEGKHNQGGTRGKLRPKLPVTTETTRQLSEMFQISFDTSSVASGDSAFSEDSRKSYIEKRRSSSSSTSSDKVRHHAESERHKSESIKEQRMSSTRSSGPMSPLSPPPQRQSEVYAQPKPAAAPQAPVAPPQQAPSAAPQVRHPSQGQVQPLQAQMPLQHQVSRPQVSHPEASVAPPQAPGPPKPPLNAMPPPPQHVSSMGHPPPPPPIQMPQHQSMKMPPPPPPMQKTQGSMPAPPVGQQRSQGGVPPPPPLQHQGSVPPPPSGKGAPPPPPLNHQGAVPQPPVMPPPPTIPAPASPVPGGAKRPSSTPPHHGRVHPPNQGRGPPPPPPLKTTPPKQNQVPRPPNTAMSPPPAPMTGMQKFTGPFSPQLSRVERQMNGTTAPPSRSPGTPPGPPTTAPKPKPSPLSPVGNQSLGPKSPRNPPTVMSPPPTPPNGVDPPSIVDKGAGIPMPPPMPLLQSSPTQTISQRISHIKHPSTGTPLSQNQGPKQTVLQKNRVTTNGGGVYEEIDNEASHPFLSELNKRSHNHPAPQYGHTMPHHTAECVPVPNQNHSGANHRRSASAGGNVIKPPGPPVAQKPDGKKAMPPPPPKRSEHTRLSSDQARQLQQQLQQQQQQQQKQQQLQQQQQAGNESQAVADPIYENCEGIMDINELPPPPPELLEGFALQQHQEQEQQRAMQAGCKKPRPPPPPPKRSKDTHLSH